MSEVESAPGGRNYLWLLAGGLAAVLVSLAVAFYANPSDLAWKLVIAFVAETGFAAIIAYLIIFFVDHRERLEMVQYAHRQDRRISAKALFSYQWDLDLPKAINEELESFVSRSAVIRRNLSLNYHLQLLPDETEFILLSGVTEYEAYNASSRRIKHPIRAWQEVSDALPPALIESHFKYNVTVEKWNEKKKKWDGRDSQKYEGTSGMDSRYARYERAFFLEHGERLRVRAEYQIPKRKYDNEIYFGLYMSEEVIANLTYDPNLFSAGADVFHASAHKASIQQHKGSVGVHCRFPFLPGNAVQVYWARHAKETSAVPPRPADAKQDNVVLSPTA